MSGQPPDGGHPHVIVGDIDAPELDTAADHHLRRVRRLRPGDRLTVTDGRGRWRWSVLNAAGLDPDGDVVTVPPPSPPVTVSVALTKADKPELVVQKLTEIGVDRIVVFRAERSVVRWDDERQRRALSRLAEVARSAVEQSRRVWVPVIDGILGVADVAAGGAVRADRDGVPLDPSVTHVAIGPEGGWTADERDGFAGAVSLGDHVLRAETAAITAGILMCTMRRDSGAG